MKNNIEKIIKNAKYLKKQYDGCHIGAYSAEAAFFFLLSAVPLLMLGIIIFTALIPIDIVGVTAFLKQILTENATGKVAEVLKDIVDRSVAPVVSLATAFLFWASTKWVRGLAGGINTIYGTDKEYNIVQITVRAAVYTFIIFLTLAVSLGVMVFASPLEKLIMEFLPGKMLLLKTLLTLLSLRNILFFLSLTLLFAFGYQALVKSKLSFKKQLPGAALAALGWIAYSFGYSVYIRYFSRYTVLYGSLGAVMLFLLWLYMCMNILLCGALFNKIRNKM